MKENYTFWHGRNFIGSMALGSDSVAKDIANGCGADFFENETTDTAYKKCSVCHTWHTTDQLKDGLCSWCGYLERLEEFITFCESELDKNWEDREELYKDDFVITYRGQALTLPFGAIEYNALIDCLKDILKENQE